MKKKSKKPASITVQVPDGARIFPRFIPNKDLLVNSFHRLGTSNFEQDYVTIMRDIPEDKAIEFISEFRPLRIRSKPVKLLLISLDGERDTYDKAYQIAKELYDDVMSQLVKGFSPQPQ